MSYIIITIFLVIIFAFIGIQAHKNPEIILYADSFDFFFTCLIYIIPLVLALGLFIFASNSIDIVKFLIIELSGFTGLLALNTYQKNRKLDRFLIAFLWRVAVGLVSTLISLLLIFAFINDNRGQKDE